jgi:ferrochelatase
MSKQAVILATHGTVEDLDDLAGFVTNIRRGHAPPPELVRELRHRYEAIGGQSPLNEITRSVARKLEARLGVAVRMASRLWKPLVSEVIGELGAERLVVVPMAQHSAPIYVEAVAKAAQGLSPSPEVVGVGNWGQTPALLDAFERRIRAAAATLSAAEREASVLLLSAHSLPKAIVDAGDPYAREAQAAAEAIAHRVRDVFSHHEIAYQSQGMSPGPGGRPMAWLGPDLPATLDAIAAAGHRRVVFAPIGFLADHVEILYDLDVEAKRWASDRGLSFARAASLNDDDDFVEVLAAMAAPLLA